MDLLRLPYEDQIHPSQWQSEGTSNTVMELSLLLKKQSDTVSRLKTQRTGLLVLLFALAAYTLLASPALTFTSVESVPVNVQPLMPTTWGPDSPSLEEIEILSANFLDHLSKQESISVEEELSNNTLIGLVLPEVRRLAVQLEKATASKKIVQISDDHDDEVLNFHKNLVKACEDEDCPKLEARKQLLAELKKTRGIPKYSQDIFPECETNPQLCSSLVLCLSSLKRVIQEASLRLPSSHDTFYLATRVALAMESFLMSLLPFEVQIGYHH
eukprot:TRINITY_DN15729_c0_g1_i1.p1 TRINITY_DN15729_c0_g1~~TRINITY_DN15729_c0_g1_i1.p1  ORF type:complete len:271 (-),score=53.21 TRINITY_DN15729_c0_g1_i1:75-887(-)